MSDALMTIYASLPVAFERGEGALLWDTEGNQYLDAISGIAVCGLGHAHPAVTKALCEQAAKLIHTSNLYQIPVQQQLAETLVMLSGMDRVFFGNSGAEANEAAIKLARLYGHGQDIDQPAIVVMENSFHGRTLATLTATGNRKVQAGFEPLVPGFVRVPYNDMEALQNVARHNPNIVAVLVEPVQGEGGVNIPEDDYLDNIRALCDEHHWLMMLDEIQTGMCRTGRWFCFQHGKGRPDVMTIAKALGNGVPIGACLARGKAAEVLQPGSHGSTFGGNPLACHVATTVIKTMQDQDLASRAEVLGKKFLRDLSSKLADNSHVTSVRGKGLMIGIELDMPCGDLVGIAMTRGMLINVTAETTIRLLPPLVITDEEADTIIDTVCSLINEFTADEQ
ncbi:MAG: aspartate aminotransferase family protein [Gammaproteobacteria bacterium]|nr:MAG: aspartate aminotransferase family protein [Gammaproteobacteria bacterium]